MTSQNDSTPAGPQTTYTTTKHEGCCDCRSQAQPILISTQVPESQGVGKALCDACRARREGRA